MSEKTERSLARVISADIADIYNDMLGLSVTFEYDDGTCQGLGGYMLDAAFVVRFMAALDVDRLSKAVGTSCWVTHSHSKVYKVEPLHKKDGRPFDIEEWGAWVKERGPKDMCWSELLTGKRRPARF